MTAAERIAWIDAAIDETYDRASVDLLSALEEVADRAEEAAARARATLAEVKSRRR